MADEAMRAMQQQSTMARQQAASELAALRHEVRAPLRGSQTTGVGVDTAAGKARRLLGCSGRVARLECSVLELR